MKNLKLEKLISVGSKFSLYAKQKVLWSLPSLDNKYSVIKSNCHKQYLSEEPKNCKKWPNPMIFRKLLCGGFGILMSQNYQTEKMLHFTGVLKW